MAFSQIKESSFYNNTNYFFHKLFESKDIGKNATSLPKMGKVGPKKGSKS